LVTLPSNLGTVPSNLDVLCVTRRNIDDTKLSFHAAHDIEVGKEARNEVTAKDRKVAPNRPAIVE